MKNPAQFSHLIILKQEKTSKQFNLLRREGTRRKRTRNPSQELSMCAFINVYLS